MANSAKEMPIRTAVAKDCRLHECALLATPAWYQVGRAPLAVLVVSAPVAAAIREFVSLQRQTPFADFIGSRRERHCQRQSESRPHPDGKQVPSTCPARSLKRITQAAESASNPAIAL
jgi:hypothetical protein